MFPQSPSAHTQGYWESEAQRQKADIQNADVHGSSAWMQPSEMENAKLHEPQKPFLFGKSKEGRELRYGGSGHCLTFAPTGAGKGVSVVVPNLLKYPGSVVCVDPKGAIAAVTAQRRLDMGHNVVLLDPFGEVENAMSASGQPERWQSIRPMSYNPFSVLHRDSDTAVDDTRLLVSGLIEQESEKNRYFSDSARMILEAFILDFLANGWPLNFESLFDVIFLEKIEWLPLMLRSDGFNGHVAHLARQIESLTGDGGDSVWSTLYRSLNLIKSPVLLPALRPSHLDFSTLKIANPEEGKPTTVYLVLPAKRLETHSIWLRLMLTSIMGQLSDARPSQHPVLFMVDECAALGRLEILETAVGLMRGYGMKLWLIFQDLPQLQSIYGKRASSFISNAGIKQFFNVNDLETADFVSQYLGNETREVTSQSIQLDQVSGSLSLSHLARPLLTSDEVRRMGKDDQILFYEGQKPIKAQKIIYHEDPDFKSLASHDPYYRGGDQQ